MKFVDKLIELGFEDYNSYLKSNLWGKTRKRFFSSKIVKRMVLTKGKPYCECCFASGCVLELHHRSYNSLGNEDLDHLILVCDPCHEAIHRRSKQENVDLWTATDLVAKEPLRDYRIKKKQRRKRKLKKQVSPPRWDDISLKYKFKIPRWLESGWSMNKVDHHLTNVAKAREKKNDAWLAANDRKARRK